MIKRIKKTLGASLIALTFSFSIAQAESTCVIPPSCAALGYTKTETDCTGMSVLKCPFDQRNVFCVTAAELPGGVGNVGDILYSDKTTNPNVVAGKIAIGIVFDPTNRLAVALKEGLYHWSEESLDIPDLQNYSDTTAVVSDWNGKNNTQAIITYCKANSKSCPAAEYTVGYSTNGTKSGDWYLPGAGELIAIYGNHAAINTAIRKVGGTKLNTNYYWSSSEYSSSDAWRLDLGGGALSYYGKGYDYIGYVRPVLAF